MVSSNVKLGGNTSISIFGDCSPIYGLNPSSLHACFSENTMKIWGIWLDPSYLVFLNHNNNDDGGKSFFVILFRSTSINKNY